VDKSACDKTVYGVLLGRAFAALGGAACEGNYDVVPPTQLAARRSSDRMEKREFRLRDALAETSKD